MTFRTRILIAAGVAALALPAVASAQSWGGDYGARWGYRGGYGFRGYPEFSGEKAHIRGEVRQGLEEGWLDEDSARDIVGELRRVQRREAREFAEHGWSLPDGDRADIQARLDRLDHEIDEARDNS